MIDNEAQRIMCQIKSLLNHMSYFIHDEDKHIVDEYHRVCRKYCSWGHPDKESENES